MIRNCLEVNSITKYYGEKLVVSDVYIKCETGNIIGLLGRNGSGKSTLLKIIFGLVSAENKFIRINGEVKTKASHTMKDISYLHQDNFIPKHFTVKKVISLSVLDKNRKEFFEDENIKSIVNKKINQLSGGELRYLEIKIVLENNSKFAILDEPYNGLSPLLAEKINNLIVENSKYKGIIITDHSYQTVLNVANNLLVMKQGNILHLKDKSELIDKGYLMNGMI